LGKAPLASDKVATVTLESLVHEGKFFPITVLITWVFLKQESKFLWAEEKETQPLPRNQQHFSRQILETHLYLSKESRLPCEF